MMSVNTRKVHNRKYQLPFVILYLNAEVGGLSMRLKIKKMKKKNTKIKKNKSKQKTTTYNNNKKLNIIAKLGFEPRSLAWKVKIIATGVLYHMAS